MLVCQASAERQAFLTQGRILDDDNYNGGSAGEYQPVLKIYHDDDVSAEPPQADAERGIGDASMAALEFE